MLHVLVADVLDSKIFNHERELHWAPLVFSEAQNERALEGALLVKPYFQELLC